MPIHLWLSPDELGTFRLGTLDGLVITVDEVDAPVDMEECGRVVVAWGTRGTEQSSGRADRRRVPTFTAAARCNRGSAAAFPSGLGRDRGPR